MGYDIQATAEFRFDVPAIVAPSQKADRQYVVIPIVPLVGPMNHDVFRPNHHLKSALGRLAQLQPSVVTEDVLASHKTRLKLVGRLSQQSIQRADLLQDALI